jgi:hypothetical protein
MVIWYILWLFGIFSQFGILYQENLATLRSKSKLVPRPRVPTENEPKLIVKFFRSSRIGFAIPRTWNCFEKLKEDPPICWVVNSDRFLRIHSGFRPVGSPPAQLRQDDARAVHQVSLLVITSSY